MTRAVTHWTGPDPLSGEPVDPNFGAPVALPPGGYRWTDPNTAMPYSAPYASAGWYAPPGTRRPSTATTAAVLAFVNAGLLLCWGLLLLIGASIVLSLQDSLDESTGLPPSIAVNGGLNVLVGGALIAGGVLLTGGRSPGRTLLTVADVVLIGQCVYWTVVTDANALALALLHAALAVVSLALAFTVESSQWLGRMRAGPPGTLPG